MCAAALTGKTEKGLAQLFRLIDEKSRALLWHLLWQRHAEICELRELIDADSDYEVLYRLRDVVNAQAQRLWGKPVVSFHQSKIDSLSGQRVLFSWWFLNEENAPISGGNRPLVDVFTEKEGVSIFAQVPTWVDQDQHEVKYSNGILKIRLTKRNNDETEKENT